MRTKITRILADTLGLPEAEITADASMDRLQAWDSVAHLNVVMSLEQEFGVQFDPDELMEMTSVDAIERALAAHGAA